MKIKHIFAGLAILSATIFASIGHAAFITAVNNGVWGDASIWDSSTVPGSNDVVFVAAGVNVTVTTNASAFSISDDTTGGAVTMAPNSTLNIYGNDGTSGLTSLNATALGNTVNYLNNPFFAKKCDYYNLVFCNTNYVNPMPPYGSPWQFFNNFTPVPTPMTIAGDMTLIGAVEVQQGSGGAPIAIAGNLIIGSGCAWDCSGDTLTVNGNAYVYGLLQDLNGALGTNYINGDILVSGPSTSVKTWSSGVYTNGWWVSDVTSWGIGGNFTNNGSTFGNGYGSISFNGAGIVAGSNTLAIPTMTVNGTYTIGTTITLTTNTPTLNGTLIFDLATTNKLIQQYVASTNQLPSYTNMYLGGNLVVINSGSAPVAGNVYQLFSAHSYAGGFASTTFPSLSPGLNWIDNTLTSGSLAVAGAIVGSPTLTLSRSGNVLTLSWDSTTYPGFSVQAQTNSAGIHSSWSSTGSGTTSPYTVSVNPANPPVFYRLSNP